MYFVLMIEAHFLHSSESVFYGIIKQFTQFSVCLIYATGFLIRFSNTGKKKKITIRTFYYCFKICSVFFSFKKNHFLDYKYCGVKFNGLLTQINEKKYESY